MTPHSPPIQIPAGGGSFEFDASVSNFGTTTQNFQVWILVQLPNGNWYGPVLGPVNLTLPAGASISRNRNQSVPSLAPAGLYTYEGRLGNYPNVIWDSDRFEFTKQAEGAIDTLWTRAYGGNGYEIGTGVLETRDGGFVVVGATNSYGAGDQDILLLKTDASGTLLWQKTFGAEGWDSGNSILQTQDEGFIIAGVRQNGNGCDLYLLKTDAAGDSVWSRTFGDVGYDDGRCVRQTPDGGFILTGCTTLPGSADKDVYLIKTDAQGDEIWSRRFGGNYDDVGNTVQITPDGGYFIVGYTYLQGTNDSDVYLIKTDAEGYPIWSRTLGGTSWDFGLDGERTPDGGYLAAGYTYSFGAGSTDVYLLKTDAQGDLIWQRTFGGAGFDYGRVVEPTANGGFLIAGSTDSFGWGEADAYFIRTDADGGEIGSWTFGGAQAEEGRDVRGTRGGGWIFAGSTSSFGSGGSDVYLVRLGIISDDDRYSALPTMVETSISADWVSPLPAEIGSAMKIHDYTSGRSFISISL